MRNPPKYDRAFHIDDGHTYIGRDMVYCKSAKDSEAHGYTSEGDVSCRLCGAVLPVRHVRAQNPTISPMLRAAVYARKGVRAGRAVSLAFRDLRRQASTIRSAWRGRAGNPASVLDTILHGDRVTIVNRFGQEHTGKAVMRGPAGWVLNMGGRHGTPGIATEKNIVRVRRSPTHRAQGMLARGYSDFLTQQIEQKRREGNPPRSVINMARTHYRELLEAGHTPSQAEKMVRNLLSVMGEAQGTPYFAANPKKSFIHLGAVRMLGFLRRRVGPGRWVSIGAAENKNAEELEARGYIEIARHPKPATWQVRLNQWPGRGGNPPREARGANAPGANAPVQIYGRTEKIFMQKTDGPYKGQKFVHSFKPGVRQIGLPARTVIKTPDGTTAAIPKRAVLLQGKADLWRNFQA